MHCGLQAASVGCVCCEQFAAECKKRVGLPPPCLGAHTNPTTERAAARLSTPLMGAQAAAHGKPSARPRGEEAGRGRRNTHTQREPAQ